MSVEHSAPRGPVFLSYASQDALVARRIADALRAAGVEVWFDQNELVGGDAWDAKIRRQIKECVLFVPVVSANTQARLEGYFRREWKLAVERTHDMADGVPFLLPVVIDDTPDSTALVPEKFREVQWTRLRLEQTPDELARHIAGLLTPSHRRGARTPEVPADRSRSPRTANGWQGRIWFGVGVLFAVVYGLRPVWNGFLPEADEPRPPATAVPAPAGREVGALLAQASALFEGVRVPGRSDFEAAEPLIVRALELDPTRAEAWALHARHGFGLIAAQYDASPDRFRQASEAADRAIRLWPQHPDARLAQATALTFNPASWPEAETELRRLVAEFPSDPRMTRTLGLALSAYGRPREALACFDQAQALPAGDPQSLLGKAGALRALGDFAGAEACADELIRLDPTGPGLIQKLELMVRNRGDLTGARELIGQIPGRLAREQGAAVVLFVVWLDLGEPDRAIAVLNALPRATLQDHTFAGPKGFLVGYAHRLAGRSEAARAEWQAALQEVEAGVAQRANDADGHLHRASLLACLGRSAEAEAALRLGEQLAGNLDRTITLSTDLTYLELGYRDEVIAYLERSRAPGSPRILSHTPVSLRIEPWWTTIRDDPRFQALLR